MPDLPPPPAPRRYSASQLPPDADPAEKEFVGLLAKALAPSYMLIRRLGAGGMGTMYVARDPVLKRLVAVKVMSPELSRDPDARSRFSREAQAVAAISHPNVVAVYAVGELENGLPYVVMQNDRVLGTAFSGGLFSEAFGPYASRARPKNALWAKGVVGAALLAFVLASDSLAQCSDGSLPPCASRKPGAATDKPLPELRALTMVSDAPDATSITNDGRWLAYRENDKLWVRNLVEGGRPIEVSRDTLQFGQFVRWFPDNNHLLTGGPAGVFAIPALGGPADLLTTPGSSTWVSPDGRLIARRAALDGRSHVEFVSIASHSTRQVAVAAAYSIASSLTWSPDGQLVVASATHGEQRVLISIAVATGATAELLRDSVGLGSPVWDKQSGSILFLREIRTTSEPTQQLWRLRVSPQGVAIGAPRVVMPLFEGSAFRLFGDGKHLTFVKQVVAAESFVRRLSGDTAERLVTMHTGDWWTHPRFSPDGTAIAYAPRDEAWHNLFTIGTDRGAPTQLTFMREQGIIQIAWSPDGRKIAYCALSTNRAQLSVHTIATGVRTLIFTEGRGITASGAFAGCGRTVWLSSDALAYQRKPGDDIVWRSLSTGNEQTLFKRDSTSLVEAFVVDSVRGHMAVARNFRGAMRTLSLVNRQDSTVRTLLPEGVSIGGLLRFSGDGNALYVSDAKQEALWRIHVGGDMRIDTLAVPRACQLIDVTADGTRVLCLRERKVERQAWAIRNFDANVTSGQERRPD